MSAFDKLNGAQKACAIAGGQTNLAKALSARGLKITPQAVSEWVRKREAVPAGKKAIAVSEITGLPLHDLNPDAYPPANAA